jgi:hypothetical protein
LTGAMCAATSGSPAETVWLRGKRTTRANISESTDLSSFPRCEVKVRMNNLLCIKQAGLTLPCYDMDKNVILIIPSSKKQGMEKRRYIIVFDHLIRNII